MKHTINIKMGDPSHDGHKMEANAIIESSLSPPELEKAYKAGVVILGWDISEMCADYEDGVIPMEMAKKFEELGVKFDEFFEPAEEGHSIHHDEFFQIYMKTCEVGNPDLKWKNMKSKNDIFIGGYGLFND